MPDELFAPVRTAAERRVRRLSSAMTRRRRRLAEERAGVETQPSDLDLTSPTESRPLAGLPAFETGRASPVQEAAFTGDLFRPEIERGKGFRPTPLPRDFGPFNPLKGPIGAGLGAVGSGFGAATRGVGAVGSAIGRLEVGAPGPAAPGAPFHPPPDISREDLLEVREVAGPLAGSVINLLDFIPAQVTPTDPEEVAAFATGWTVAQIKQMRKDGVLPPTPGTIWKSAEAIRGGGPIDRVKNFQEQSLPRQLFGGTALELLPGGVVSGPAAQAFRGTTKAAKGVAGAKTLTAAERARAARGAGIRAAAEGEAAFGRPGLVPQGAVSERPRLPRDLVGAKPRYGLGRRQFTVEFEDDVDKALYIVAQRTPSKRDADYLAFLERARGLKVTEARVAGAAVRARVKAAAQAAEADDTSLRIPRMSETAATPEIVDVGGLLLPTQPVRRTGAARARPAARARVEPPTTPREALPISELSEAEALDRLFAARGLSGPTKRVPNEAPDPRFITAESAQLRREAAERIADIPDEEINPIKTQMNQGVNVLNHAAESRRNAERFPSESARLLKEAEEFEAEGRAIIRGETPLSRPSTPSDIPEPIPPRIEPGVAVRPTREIAMAQAEQMEAQRRSMEGLNEALRQLEVMQVNGAPTGLVPSPDTITSPAQAQAALRNALFNPIVDSPSDVAATRYWETGDFGGFIDDLPPEIPVSGSFRRAGYADVSAVSARISDPTRLLQAIDRGFFNGPLQKYVLWPTRRLFMAGLKWSDTEKAGFKVITERYEMSGSIHKRKMREAAGDVIEFISQEDALRPVSTLLENRDIRKAVARFSQAEQGRIIEYAKDTRRVYDRLLEAQNAARAKRGQEAIPLRQNYRPWIRETNLWARLGFRSDEPRALSQQTPVPDFIKPNKPFNPRELPREGGLRDYPKVRDLHRLTSDYIDTAMRDIFHTEIIRNAKPHIKVVAEKGHATSAKAMEDWIFEAYAGVRTPFTKFVRDVVPDAGVRAILGIRRQLTRAVFPLNVPWNLYVQTSSLVPTFARYGIRDTLRGLDYLYLPSARRWTKSQVYSTVIKSRRGGKISAQDIGGVGDVSLRLETSALDTVEDISNFLTSAIEDNLTGVSVRAAYHSGRRQGFKGRQLVEWASEGGSKTQSMYNPQDLPGHLRSRELQAMVPFQTFAFEMFNTVREFNLPLIRRVIGKTGAFETISAATPAGKALATKRMRQVLIFVAGMVVVNMAADKAINRKPWVVGSFVPAFGLFTGAMNPGSPFGYPLPIRYVGDFWDGVEDSIKHGNLKDLRQWFIRYHVLAGTQVDRMWRGMEAVATGGVEDVTGRRLYDVEPDELLTAITGGPHTTEGGREFIKRVKGDPNIAEELLGFPLPSREEAERTPTPSRSRSTGRTSRGGERRPTGALSRRRERLRSAGAR